MKKRGVRGFVAVLVGIVVQVSAFATTVPEGDFDPTFGNGGRLLVDVSADPSDSMQTLILRPDGKLLMGGTCGHVEDVQSFPTFCVTQLLADGTYDGNFAPAGLGYVRFDHFASWPNNSSLSDMILLRDGRIALLGTTTGAGQMLFAVLLADGTALDSSVGGGLGYITVQFNGKASLPKSLIEQSDKKILIAGGANGANGNLDFAVGRLLADFSGFDTSFGTGGSQIVAFDLGGPSGDNTDLAEVVRLQSNGKIVLAGVAVSSPASVQPFNAAQIALVRLNTDGSRDTTFGSTGDGRLHYSAGAPEAAAGAMQIDAADRIVLGGAVINGSTTQWIIDRLTRDGARDPTFNQGNPQLFSQPPGNGGIVQHLALTNDGIFGIGNTPRTATSTTNYFAVVRLNADGLLDARFGNSGRSYGSFTATNDTDTTGMGIAVGNGGVMVAGSQTQSSNVQFGIGRLEYDQIFTDGFE